MQARNRAHILHLLQHELPVDDKEVSAYGFDGRWLWGKNCPATILLYVGVILAPRF